MDRALRYNDEKIRLSLMSFPALYELGRVYTEGAKKYPARNWEKGLPYMEVLDSLLRHLFVWRLGERNDPELGTHHLANAAWNIITLLHMELDSAKYRRFDDRNQAAAATGVDGRSEEALPDPIDDGPADGAGKRPKLVHPVCERGVWQTYPCQGPNCEYCKAEGRI